MEIEEVLQSGCKKKEDGIRLGVELEHFLVDAKTMDPVPYLGNHGVEEILTVLMQRGCECYREIISESHLIGYYCCAEYEITLEPAAQLEISIRPVKDFREVLAIYRRFRTEIDPILAEFGYQLVMYGYQPHAKTEDLTLIPKKRYRLMDAHFAGIGPFGRYMMRGTAATQISIDYFDEEDFSLKYKLAYALRLPLCDLCDNMPVFEGRTNTEPHYRHYIWEHVDPTRVDISPYLVNGTVDFAGYARFVKATPAIVPADGRPKEQHMMSMVFPDIRASKYLEIRVADSMPIAAVAVYAIIIRTLFASPEEALMLMEREHAKEQIPLFVYRHAMDVEKEYLDEMYEDFTKVTNLVRDMKK